MASRIEEALRGVPEDDPRAIKEALDQIDSASLSQEERMLWYQLRADAATKSGESRLAMKIVDAGLIHEPESGVLHFQKGVALEARGRIEDALEEWQNVTLKDGPDRLVTISRYCYLWDQHEAGLRMLHPLVAEIQKIGTGDPAVLHKEGLPSVLELMGYLVVFARLMGRPEGPWALLERFREKLDNAPVDILEPELRCFLDDDCEDYEEYLQTWADQADEQAAIPLLALALRQSTREEYPATALQHLEQLRLPRNEMPWLEDLRALGKAAVCHRFGLDQEENLWVERVFRAQPRLFEPNHVVTFGIFEYQEVLKERYRTQRRRWEK